MLAWMPNDMASVRIGFVISKRISKHAVIRNYIKRLLSEAIRPVLADLPQGLDIVFSARGQIVGADLFTLRQDIITLLRRARLLASPSATESSS